MSSGFKTKPDNMLGNLFISCFNTPVRFIISLTILRVFWHMLSPVGMAGDESYYWLWGQHWDWGYYSKPPFIGWFFGLADLLPLPKIWLFKSCAALFSAGSLYFLYKCFLTVSNNQKLAWYGLLAIGLSPANLLFASILTIDAPLMFFWAGGMYFSAKLLFQDAKKTDYLCLFIFLALGHLTKQMMMFQLIIILLCALTLKRELLKKPLFWLALLGSVISLLPPILWNAANQWITVQHTGHHFESSSPKITKSLSRLAELIGALLALVSPLIFLQFFPAIGSSLRKMLRPSRNRATTFFFFFGALGLLVMLGMVFRQRINPNWPAAFLLGGLGISLLWAFEREARIAWFRRGLWVAGSLSLVMMILLPLLEPCADVFAKTFLKPQKRGWRGYDTLVSQSYDLLPAEVDQIAFVGHRFIASQFAFHGKQLSPNSFRSVHLWNGGDHINNQFDFFPDPEVGKPIAIIVEKKKEGRSFKIPEQLRNGLVEITEVGEFPVHRVLDHPRYKIYLAKKLVKWPTSPARINVTEKP